MENSVDELHRPFRKNKDMTRPTLTELLDESGIREDVENQVFELLANLEKVEADYPDSDPTFQATLAIMYKWMPQEEPDHQQFCLDLLRAVVTIQEGIR